MTWRVILRFSLNRDMSSALRNAIAIELRNLRFQRTKTGTWECDDFKSAALAMRSVREVTRRLENPTRYVPNSRAIMDHLWVYADQTPRRPAID